MTFWTDKLWFFEWIVVKLKENRGKPWLVSPSQKWLNFTARLTVNFKDNTLLIKSAFERLVFPIKMIYPSRFKWPIPLSDFRECSLTQAKLWLRLGPKPGKTLSRSVLWFRSDAASSSSPSPPYQPWLLRSKDRSFIRNSASSNRAGHQNRALLFPYISFEGNFVRFCGHVHVFFWLYRCCLGRC